MDLMRGGVLVGASMVAGAVNSVAGGGTLLTFPALLWMGQSALVANATSTVALFPGQMSSLWGYRREIGRERGAVIALGGASLVGGITGAMLLLSTNPKTFERIVPFLLLAATALFMIQEPVSRWLRSRAPAPPDSAKTASANAETPPADASIPPALEDYPVPAPPQNNAAMVSMPVAAAIQFFIAIYGGYFGAGAGILMLTALGLMGYTNIHQMNGLKNLNAGILNGIAALIFIVKGLVDWRLALLMACGSVVGGLTGAGTARRIGQKNVRRIIIGVGFALTMYLLARQL